MAPADQAGRGRSEEERLGVDNTEVIESDEASSNLAAPAGPEVAEDFASLFAEHYRRVVRALELSGLDRWTAEDVAQEAFARTLGHWRRVRNGTNPAGYVFRVAFRQSRRAFSGREALSLEREPRSPSDTETEVAARVDLESALRALPPRRRACAVACFVVGLSTKEAAHALGVAEGTVRKQLEHARRGLASHLEVSGGEEDAGPPAGAAS